ncbi:hypothetical protein BHE74_00014659 [Ensete ventricosum]|nr:hypothetical protein BHE74_00014659 [Ensete ventricosum]RZR83271.1 hypothetical protein BHM03_00009853 [Ensete ventricosum]
MAAIDDRMSKLRHCFSLHLPFLQMLQLVKLQLQESTAAHTVSLPANASLCNLRTLRFRSFPKAGIGVQHKNGEVNEQGLKHVAVVIVNPIKLQLPKAAQSPSPMTACSVSFRESECCGGLSEGGGAAADGSI